MLSNQARVKRSFIIFRSGLLDANELPFFKMEGGETLLVADIFHHTRKFLTNDFGSFHNGRSDRRIVMLSRDRKDPHVPIVPPMSEGPHQQRRHECDVFSSGRGQSRLQDRPIGEPFRTGGVVCQIMATNI